MTDPQTPDQTPVPEQVQEVHSWIDELETKAKNLFGALSGEFAHLIGKLRQQGQADVHQLISQGGQDLSEAKSDLTEAESTTSAPTPGVSSS